MDVFGLGCDPLESFITLLKGERCDNLLVFTLLLVDKGAFYYFYSTCKIISIGILNVEYTLSG